MSVARLMVHAGKIGIMAFLCVVFSIAGVALVAEEIPWHSKDHTYRVPFKLPQKVSLRLRLRTILFGDPRKLYFFSKNTISDTIKIESQGTNQVKLFSMFDMSLVVAECFAVYDAEGNSIPVFMNGANAMTSVEPAKQYYLYFSSPFKREGIPRNANFDFKKWTRAEPQTPITESEVINAQFGRVERVANWIWGEGRLCKIDTQEPTVAKYFDNDWTDYDVELKVKYTYSWVGISFRIPPPGITEVCSATWVVRHVPDDGRLWAVNPVDTVGHLSNPEWNIMKISIRGREASFYMNGSFLKKADFGEGTSPKGTVAIYTSGSAEFDYIKVTAPSGEVLLDDDFLEKKMWWSIASISAPFGCFRIVNTGDTKCQFFTQSIIHRSPWHLANGHLAPDFFKIARDSTSSFAPGMATAWIPFNAFNTSTFSTLFGRFDERYEKLPFVGRIEIADIPFGNRPSIIKTFDIKPGDVKEGFGFEITKANFGSPLTLLEIELATANAVAAMKVPGSRPKVFPAGFVDVDLDYPENAEACLRTGAELGFSSVAVIPSAWMEKYGYTYGVAFSHVLQSRANLGYDYDGLVEEFRRIKADYDRLGIKVHIFDVWDEASYDIWADLKPEEAARKADQSTWHWQQAFRGASSFSGIPLSAFGRDGEFNEADPKTYNGHWDIYRCTPENIAKYPLKIFQSALVIRGFWPCRLGHAALAIKEVFGEDMHVRANIDISALFSGSQSGLDMITLYRPVASYWRPDKPTALDSPQACDYYCFSGPSAVGYLTDVFRSTKKYGKRYISAMFAAQESYFPTSPYHLLKRGVTYIGAGADEMEFYSYGPRYFATVNWFSTDMERLKAIKRICHMVGFAEDILVGSRVPPSQVAIVSSDTEAIWACLKDRSVLNANNQQWLYMMLRYLGYSVDFFAEADLLDPNYFPVKDCPVKTLFLAQNYMRKECAARVAEWVKAGGTVIAVNGIGQTSEALESNVSMLDLFGYSTFETTEGKQGSIEVLKMARPTKDLSSLEVMAERRPIGKVSTAEVLAVFDDQSPAITINKSGKGSAIAINCSLPMAFIYNGQKGKLITDQRDGSSTNYNEGPARLLEGIINLTGPVARLAWASSPYVDVRMRIHPEKQQGIVSLVDNSGQNARKAIKVVIYPEIPVKRITSCHRGDIKFTRHGESIKFRIPLTDVDVLRLE